MDMTVLWELVVLLLGGYLVYALVHPEKFLNPTEEGNRRKPMCFSIVLTLIHLSDRRSSRWATMSTGSPPGSTPLPTRCIDRVDRRDL